MTFVRMLEKVIKMLKVISILLIAGITTSRVHCSSPPPEAVDPPLPYALSSTYLTYLAKTEQEVYKEIKQYTNDLKERLHLAQAYLKDYEDSTLKGTSHLPENTDPWQKAAEATFHPLIAYRMVRRFSHEFQNFVEHMGISLESKLEERLKAKGLHNWPGIKDHEEAMDAILRLHYVYDMDMKQFTNGNIGGIETNVGLTAAQVFKFAEYAVDNEYYTLALDWLSVAESKSKYENYTFISPFQIANAYRRNTEMHDKEYERNKKLQHLYIFDGKLEESTDPNRMRDVKINYYIKNLEDPAIEAGHYIFLAMCNGANFQNETVKSKLKCWSDTQIHPYFTISPLKMELLNQEPPLLQIYDMITDSWINELKKTAIPSLKRPPPVVPGATPRTAAYAWLQDEHIPNVPLSRKIELITNLNVRGMMASDALQIAAYAFGGHVSTHFDSLAASNPDDPVIAIKGDRVSTFLIYLNEVEKGGFTPFPLIGAYVKPVKGSAVFWYTALKNGTIDTKTLHGACKYASSFTNGTNFTNFKNQTAPNSLTYLGPVMMGHKWIATKWTHLNENMWKRPCDLDSTL